MPTERHIYVKLAGYDTSGNEIRGPSGNHVGNVVVDNLSQQLALYTPSRDTYTQWAFGQDDTFSDPLTTGVGTWGIPMDARHTNQAARSILVIAGGATNYDWQIKGGRNNIHGQAGSIATGTGVSSVVTLIGLDDQAWAPWLHFKITHNSGDLTYKVVLLARGG